MNRPWFDAETGLLKLDDYVQDMPSFRKVLEDGVVSGEELEQHAHRVVDLLRELESRLPADLQVLATDALCELAVLYALQRRYMEQSIGF